MSRKPKQSDDNALKAALAEDPPEHNEHGEDSWQHPIFEKLVQAKCWNWRMEGPGVLKCDTDFGPFQQILPTNVICLGEKDGLPILKEL